MTTHYSLTMVCHPGFPLASSVCQEHGRGHVHAGVSVYARAHVLPTYVDSWGISRGLDLECHELGSCIRIYFQRALVVNGAQR